MYKLYRLLCDENLRRKAISDLHKPGLLASTTRPQSKITFFPNSDGWILQMSLKPNTFVFGALLGYSDHTSAKENKVESY